MSSLPRDDEQGKQADGVRALKRSAILTAFAFCLAVAFAVLEHFHYRYAMIVLGLWGFVFWIDSILLCRFIRRCMKPIGILQIPTDNLSIAAEKLAGVIDWLQSYSIAITHLGCPPGFELWYRSPLTGGECVVFGATLFEAVEAAKKLSPVSANASKPLTEKTEEGSAKS